VKSEEFVRNMLTIGIDLGSTTVKYALLSESGVLLSHDYLLQK
jgi:activator of 2-hydroxyglutaryl-CoA dehydratase